MGFHEDHRNIVADRWGQKYRESDLSTGKFKKYMEQKMKEYGWSEKDIKIMCARAIGKGDEQ